MERLASGMAGALFVLLGALALQCGGLLFLTRWAFPRGGYSVGVAWVDITPEVGTPLAGFSSRNSSSTGALEPLRLTALCAKHSTSGSELNILSYDLIGCDRKLMDEIYSAISKRTAARRADTLLLFSHTHSGPVVGNNLRVLHSLDSAEQAAVDKYVLRLVDASVEAMQNALGTRERDCHLEFGIGSSPQGVNRRKNKEAVYDATKPSAGPVDHAVQVLVARRRDRSVNALLFGYAGHGTVLTTELRASNDWIGFAREHIEKKLPGSTALFMQGCGGDVNLYPRGNASHGAHHGEILGNAALAAAASGRRELRGGVRCLESKVQLPLTKMTHQRGSLRRLAAATGDKYSSRLASLLLNELPSLPDTFFSSYSYPFWVCRFEASLLIVALSGEAVSDYSLRLRKELATQDLFIAGYAGEVMGYVPSAAVAREGGYEAGERSAVLYGLPGRFGLGTEDRIVGAVISTVRSIGRG